MRRLATITWPLWCDNAREMFLHLLAGIILWWSCFEHPPRQKQLFLEVLFSSEMHEVMSYELNEG